VIPDEAVEAAARAHYEISTDQYMPWEQIDGAYRNATYLFPMRAALEAVTEHLMATAWDDAIEAYKAWTWDDENMEPLANPYRKGAK